MDVFSKDQLKNFLNILTTDYLIETPKKTEKIFLSQIMTEIPSCLKD